MIAAGLLVAPTAVLHESVVQSGPFQVLAAFVALNTIMYSALAVAKMLPKIYPGDWLDRRNRRRHNRSIHPGAGPR